MYQKLSRLGLSLLITGIICSCSSKGSDNGAATTTYTFSDTMTSANVVPSFLVTGGSGSLKGTYNSSTRILTVSITNYVSGSTVNGVHIHLNGIGLNGSILYTLAGSPYTFPITYSTPALSASDETELLNNNFYVDVHATLHPAGEARGQLIKR